ncbi:membrane bound O-acyl transferase family-domain-containing protein [Coniochaeta sp. 2T2.1]|nr:membrane bound O-acyl transferase family-domain-containing protein [Coniochaeta sp. 2T2.1]
MASFWWMLATNPVTLLVIEGLHVAVMTGFTSPDSFWRLATLPFQFWLIWVGIKAEHALHYSQMITGMVTGIAMTYPMDYIGRVLLQKWSYEVGGPAQTFRPSVTAVAPEHKTNGHASHHNGSATTNGGAKHANGKVKQANGTTTKKGQVALPGSFWAKLAFGIDVATSRRHLNRPSEVKNCPHFSEKDHAYTPSCRKFILSSIATIIACYAFLDINDANAQSNRVPHELFSQDKIPFFSRLSDVTLEEFFVRLTVPVMIAATAYCMLQISYYGVAIVAVGLGVTGVEEWRPLFGSVFEIYSLRNFWGKFWHQMYRDLITDPAHVIAHDVLGLPARGLVTKYVKLLVAVLVSAFFHLLIDLGNGHTWSESQAFYFYTVQALGVMVEDAVVALWTRCFGKPDPKSRLAGMQRHVGAVWLWAFMAWTVPSWMYLHIERRAAAVDKGPLMGMFSISSWVLGKI